MLNYGLFGVCQCSVNRPSLPAGTLGASALGSHAGMETVCLRTLMPNVQHWPCARP